MNLDQNMPATVLTLARLGTVGVICLTASVACAARAPDLVDVSYGPHERNVLDLWKAKSEGPTPLMVFIHGGGFINGDKGQIRRRPVVEQCLQAGVSFASLNYRFRNQAAIQDILRDAARAIQFLRSRAAEWNIDPARIACYGGSAGAGTSLWLAFHDDLADPNSADPVLRQSSRLAAAGALNGQASYDLRDWEKLLGPTPYGREPAELREFYWFKDEGDAASPSADKIMKDCSMINLITPDDPPVALACFSPAGEPKNRGEYVHHPKHSQAIAERCKRNGIDCLLELSDNGPTEREPQMEKVVAFLLEKLKTSTPTTAAK